MVEGPRVEPPAQVVTVEPPRPTLTAVQERLARQLERQGVPLVDGSPREPAREDGPEAVTAEPAAHERREAPPETPEESIPIEQWLALDASTETARQLMLLSSMQTSIHGLESRYQTMRRTLKIEVDSHRMSLKQANEILGKVYTTIDRKKAQMNKMQEALRSSEDPHDRALGADLDIHLEKMEIQGLEMERRLLRETGGDTTEIDKRIADKTQALQEQQQLREQIKDENDTTIEDQMPPGVRAIIEKSKVEEVIGHRMTDEQLQRLATEPLNVLEELLSEVVDPANPQRIRELVTNLAGSGLMNNEQADEVRTALESSYHSKDSKLAAIGVSLGAILLALGWAASQRNRAGQMQQG
ncbi:hypothetical protein A2862_03370 [Candidatus Roizmanbacteria bacterium RIFCSPHIGHO2_01_FULL_38_41]|uniref:Uncharacterized protein n=1 Tax=Candidatus Roizmanbacteria bacterium RIFCSPHIGHO2_02_FULL_37_24 TaxID=1802037 RepID=A0A1F7H0D4_9BACT|nr:MAG: hypothetical protein A2862_03370 [Candidatus Roizmanbacteria bacterium RIFCSPHIGHO2_01_FULL_38_41]OGK24598.1 MAG: hypothetical protein A3C24_02300 [Candidatus Roizmanbacteria bacterium RIFCSPHIGHO2_02_FULL_37_24]OGK32236.1 MAG: hypothetical protein A3E10_02240 [Candidatus Roizmanbacteria bacterium RIFCSPHIGHO2_12_FULL_37_23]OGK44829.1 MAG: hypothetical protein A2956_04310 [Candidatus Roizmanbacteria bacterium RIFCSPLOWO2_01_FULL_37_57]